ncbi:unnamed protein product (macronuclear) [Paramecium tetraurelia]|uniref:Bromo domain-containing protein n=2 Tax=Paramecium TaxID=5884 RepID=A0DAD7_PARTE|nr:uncharacterized protein GSPATT00014911001 [Paramecium tetraurelia]CAD8175846.1 unnamed protein product [Paramecium octaurelia]CAK80004.1 unnamed protein product [Paramecium tetraurelia]|eukprot:XP_001447401.1 hypothetical protein (macronuclear) [Paramecium tetraurelia strain d4-2]
MFESLKNWLFHDDQGDFEQFKLISKQPKLRLPPNFAQQILDLELELENEKVNQKMVNDLLALYKLGTEYYGQNDDKKYKIFTEKASKLLMKSNVQKAFEPSQKQESRDAISTAREFNQNNSLMRSMINRDLQKQEENILQRRQNRREILQSKQ